MKAKGYFYGCLSSATYGLIPLFTLPIMAKGMVFDSILFYRFLCATIAIGCMMMIRKESFRVEKKEMMPLAVLGVLFAFSALFLFWGYTFMAAGIASTILFLYPVFVTLLMAFLFHEKVSRITQFAIVLAFAGVALLYKGDVGTTLNPVGVVIVLLSSLSYATYIIVVNKSAVKGMSGAKLTFYAMLVSACFFLIKAQVFGGLQSIPDWETMTNILLLAIVPTVVSCISMVYSVHYIGSTATAVLGAMEPVTAVCVGVLVFGEPFTSNLALGILLIIMSVTLIILSKHIMRNFVLIHHRVAFHIFKKG